MISGVGHTGSCLEVNVRRALSDAKFNVDTLRTSIAGNVHRLGAQESTPAMISLGTVHESWRSTLKNIIEGGPLKGYGDASSIPRGMMYLVNQGKALNDKKTIEENSIEAGTTIATSLENKWEG